MDDGVRFKAIKKLSFISCDEPHFVLFIKNTTYTIFIWRGKVYWDDTATGESLSFEEIFDKLPDDAKEEILFNLDLFN